MNQPVIHIGSIKTGSTTLQRALFPKSKGLVYLGEDCADFDNYKSLLESLVSDDDIYFRSKETKDLFQTFAEKASRNRKTFLYSNEDIARSRLPMVCAKRLHEILPNAKILLMIRNQWTAIPSLYVNHGAYLRWVPRSYFRRHVSFNDWMEYCTTSAKDAYNPSYSPLDSFLYNQIISLYASLFGKENIHILLFEDFVNDRKKFIFDLCRILETDPGEAERLLEQKHERRRETMREFRYHRFRNRFFGGIHFSRFLPFGKKLATVWDNFLKQGGPADGFMSEFWKKKTFDIYAKDNAKLASDYNLPLEKYGYPLINTSS